MKLPRGLEDAQASSLLRAVVACGLESARLNDWPDEPLPPSRWDEFSAHVRQHRVWSMVAGAIVSGKLPASPEQAEQAFREDDASVVTCLQLDRVLLDVNEALIEGRVDGRFFKGAATALRFYREPGLRPYSDVDVLLPEDHLGRLTTTLRAMGATRAGQSPWSAFLMPGGWEVDVHPTLRHGPFGAAVPTKDLFDGRTTVDIGGTDVPTISDQAAFIAACFNAILPSDLRRLVPLRDVATMAESGLLNEAFVIETATRWRSAVVVAAAARIAADLFELESEAPFVGWAADYTPTRRESRWLDAYLDITPRGGLKQLGYTTEALGTTSERIRFLRGQFLHEGRKPARVRAKNLWARMDAASAVRRTEEREAPTHTAEPSGRAVHVVDTLSIGGAERMAVDISNELAHRGATVDLVATRALGPLQSDVRDGVHVHSLERASRWDIQGLRRFRSLVKQRHPMVVHAHGWSSLQFCTVGLLGLREPPALVFHDHRPLGLAPLSPMYRVAAWALTRAHLAVDRALLDPPIRTLNRSVSQVVPNGIPLDRFTRKRSYLVTDTPHLVLLANLRPQKDHHNLFEAIAQLTQSGVKTHVDLVGSTPDPDYLAACMKQVVELGVDSSITVMGSSDDTGQLLSTYDAAILSSRTESGPIALIEYLAAGLPFVVTDVGEIPAMLPEDLRLGVVPPNDPDALASALQALLSTTPAQREARANAGIEFAREHLSIERTVDAIEAIYRIVTR